MELTFEWDEDKAASNLRKHRVSFLTGAAIFSSEMLEQIDDREDYGEPRRIAVGRAGTKVYRVVYTWRGNHLIRVISVQKASRDERESYHGAIFTE
jgi:uncharacterized DUF497 family protein